MKKLTVSMVTALLLSTFVPIQSKAANESSTSSMVSGKTAASAEAQALLARLDEINSMDKSTLTKPEKKQLRKEVRSINKSLRTISGGVYISVGAIIVILLLLLLLL
jgi:Flp pilus assembly protein TadB